MDGTNQEQVQQCKSYLIDQIPAGNVYKEFEKKNVEDPTLKIIPIQIMLWIHLKIQYYKMEKMSIHFRKKTRIWDEKLPNLSSKYNK